MDRIFADLHNHTIASDGDISPAQLVAAAEKLGLGAVGVTDHDTDQGIEEAVDASRHLEIEVIPGVEVSIRFKRSYFMGTLHLLCYFSRTLARDPIFRREFSQILSKGRGIDLITGRVNEINRIFGPDGATPVLKKELLADQILEYSTNASRRHFAKALAEKHQIADTAVISRIIGNASPAYLPSGIDLEAVAPFLKQYRLVTVLAHPAAGSFPGQGHYREVLPPVDIVEKLLPEFLQAGLDGLEIYYPGHTGSHRDLLLSWAGQFNLLVTGGSDCHDLKDRPLGITGINQSLFLKFKDQLP